MIYLDSSYIVKCYIDEPGAAAVLNLVEGQRGLVSSLHGRLEVWSAVHRHVRERHLTRAQAKAVLGHLARDERDGVWTFAPITAELVHRACTTVAGLGVDVFVRSADALHLICARDLGAKEIYSNDAQLLRAAPHFGLRGRNVIES